MPSYMGSALAGAICDVETGNSEEWPGEAPGPTPLEPAGPNPPGSWGGFE